MSRARWLGLAVTMIVVLVLVGSMIAGLGGGSGAAGEDAGGAPNAPQEGRLRVEVLNAAGIPGLARTATRSLRDQGFDVVYFGNARAFHQDSSMVLVRRGEREGAERVARALGMPRVEVRPDSSLYLDVTVVIGRDWEGARIALPDSLAADPAS